MSTEPLRCAGALVVGDDGRIFFQRRSPRQKRFPKTWDLAGGHLEPIRQIAEHGFRTPHLIGP